MVYRCVGGKRVYVELIGVSPLVGVRVGVFRVGHATLKVASNKAAKHEKTCYDNKHVFIPFAFDTFSFLALGTVDLLHKVQRVMHNNVMSLLSL